jgi:predicted  nucleic acid-binding Zn-ribbon protein
MSATLTAPITGAFRKAREAMQGDPQAKLSSARERIKALEKRLTEIQGDIEKYHRRFADKVEQCRKRFESSKSFPDEFAYRVAKLVEKDSRDNVDPALRARMMIYAPQTIYTLKDEAFAKLVEEWPNWREPFTELVEAKVAIAKRACDETLATVRTQLADFDEEDVTNDPRIRRVKSELERAESTQARFRDAEGLKGWQIGISALNE